MLVKSRFTKPAQTTAAAAIATRAEANRPCRRDAAATPKANSVAAAAPSRIDRKLISIRV